MQAFIFIATALFMFLTVIWSKSNWANFLIKLVFFGMMVYGIVLILSVTGVIGKI
jgi:hypothetical protein